MSGKCGCILCGGCIICANGNDLPEGETCPSCKRVGPAIHDHGLRLRDVANNEVRSALHDRAAPQIKRCKACDGTGYFMTEEELSAPDTMLFPVGQPADECKVCDGTGYVDIVAEGTAVSNGQ